MSTRRIIFGFLVCFSMAVFVGQTLSQTRRYSGMRGSSKRGRLRNIDRTQKQQELERRRLKKQFEGQLKQISPDKSEKELMKQVLRATEEQWNAIEPKLDKVRELRNRANVSIRLMCFGGASVVSGMGGSSVAVKNGVGRGSGSMSGFGSSSPSHISHIYLLKA